MVSNVQGNIMHSNITQHKQKELQVWHLHFASSVNELSTKVAIHQKSRNVCWYILHYITMGKFDYKSGSKTPKANHKYSFLGVLEKFENIPS